LDEIEGKFIGIQVYETHAFELIDSSGAWLF